METVQKMLYDGLNPEEYSHIPHTVCFDDFNTNYPASNRINRIASEINEYLRYKNKCGDGIGKNIKR